MKTFRQERPPFRTVEEAVLEDQCKHLKQALNNLITELSKYAVLSPELAAAQRKAIKLLEELH